MRSSHRVDFSQRVRPRDLPELMDGDCSYEEFRDCLRSLQKVNRWSLGYRPTLAWLDRLRRLPSQPLNILDVGSGGGDLLRQIAKWAHNSKIAVSLTGIDLNPYATRAAKEFTSEEAGITWITGDAMTYISENPIDLIVSSLMTHHLEDEEIVTLLWWMDSTARVGWFINDLERSQWSARIFGWMPWHPMVQHDGPVSFQRAFLRQDWLDFLRAAGIPEEAVTIEKWRPARLCVGRWK